MPSPDAAPRDNLSGSPHQPHEPHPNAPWEIGSAQFNHSLGHYREFKGKGQQRDFFTKDIAFGNIEISERTAEGRIALRLFDLEVVQRLRDVTQLSSAGFVYKDGGHVRLSHVLGSAYLAIAALEKIKTNVTDDRACDVDKYGPAVVAAAMLHDLGHVAPRSHLAERVWYPKHDDAHETISMRLVQENPGIRHVLHGFQREDSGLAERVIGILRADDTVPPWTWMLVSGGGWNVDRGDWVLRDSRNCGISKGEYDVNFLLRRLTIAPEPDSRLGIMPSGESPLRSFYRARLQMYEEVYSHDVARVGDEMHKLLVDRARKLLAQGALPFADDVMQVALSHPDPHTIDLGVVQSMTDDWWKYHLQRWYRDGSDPILADLSKRLARRNLFKYFKDNDPDRRELLRDLVVQSGLDPDYYVLPVPEFSFTCKKDLQKAMVVVDPSRGVVELPEYISAPDIPLEQVSGFGGGFVRPRLIAVPVDIFANYQPN